MNVACGFTITPITVFLSLFWPTRGIELIVLLLLLTSAFIFFRIRMNKIKNQQDDLKRQVLERNELLSYSKLNEQKARKEAEVANKNKIMLISKISHDVRTPMNAIMGMASLLNETNLTTEQREYAATILNSGESLLRVVHEILINDILECSKVDSGNELEEKDFELRSSIEEVLDLFAAKAANANLELIYNIEANVPSQIIGDAFRLGQILMNLVENSFRFTSQGEIFIGVKFVEHRENDQIKLQFEVRDTGMGMTESRIDQVTKDLIQPGTFGETNEAIGLTLVICKRLVNLMGGSIKVESIENEGTSFKFTIWSRVSPQCGPIHTSIEMTGLEGKKILVVDDNNTSGISLKAQLKQLRLHPILVHSGKQALEILKQNSAIDLVITDMQMPQMDGVQLTEFIKQLRPDLPVILLDKAKDDNFRKHSDAFSAVIEKPVKYYVLSKYIFSSLRQNTVTLLHQEDQDYKQKLSVAFSQKYPLQILVAEDDKLNQKFALKILNKLGYEPHLVTNGQEVLEIVSQRKYDVILMDVQMPVMNGLEATKMIRLCLADQPYIVAMTANTLQGDREECMRAGMDDYISKPINLNDLVSALEKGAIQYKEK